MHAATGIAVSARGGAASLPCVTPERRRGGAHVRHIRRLARQDGAPRVGGCSQGRRTRRRVRAGLGPIGPRPSSSSASTTTTCAWVGRWRPGRRPMHRTSVWGASITPSTSTPSTAGPRAWRLGCAARVPRRRSRCRASPLAHRGAGGQPAPAGRPVLRPAARLHGQRAQADSGVQRPGSRRQEQRSGAGPSPRLWRPGRTRVAHNTTDRRRRRRPRLPQL